MRESCTHWDFEYVAATGASEDGVLEAIELRIQKRGGPARLSEHLGRFSIASVRISEWRAA
jgi:hypothetical protein